VVGSTCRSPAAIALNEVRAAGRRRRRLGFSGVREPAPRAIFTGVIAPLGSRSGYSADAVPSALRPTRRSPRLESAPPAALLSTDPQPERSPGRESLSRL